MESVDRRPAVAAAGAVVQRPTKTLAILTTQCGQRQLTKTHNSNNIEINHNNRQQLRKRPLTRSVPLTITTTTTTTTTTTALSALLIFVLLLCHQPTGLRCSELNNSDGSESTTAPASDDSRSSLDYADDGTTTPSDQVSPLTTTLAPDAGERSALASPSDDYDYGDSSVSPTTTGAPAPALAHAPAGGGRRGTPLDEDASSRSSDEQPAAEGERSGLDGESETAPGEDSSSSAAAAAASGESRSSSEESVAPRWLDMFKNKKPKELSANPNSGVQKGTATELPPVEETQSGDSRSAPPNRLGVVPHSDDPKAQAENSPADSSDSDDDDDSTKTSSTTTSTTAAPSSRSGAAASAASDDDEEGDSRAALETLNKVFGPPPQPATGKQPANKTATTSAPSAKGPAAAFITTVVPKLVTGKAAKAAMQNKTAINSAGGNNNNYAKITAKSVTDLKNAKRTMPDLVAQEKARNLTANIEKLGQVGEKLAAKKNTSIVINGRKFDQVESIECVDDRFYQVLMNDLNLVVPDRRQDYYGTYFDPDYAKAIGALVETPAFRSSTGVEGSEGKLPIKDILAEVRQLWKVTMDTYTSRRSQLDMNNLPLGRSALPNGATAPSSSRLRRAIASANFEPQPRHQAALANYRYLLERLEQLKLLLLSGEEALIVMNNKVRKLNQAVGETELARALCSCVTSRSGRGAFSLMNELFVDKNSAQLMKKIDEAKRRGDDTAVDTAEFCAYWYGDTIRSEAVQKEKQIKRLVLAVAKERAREQHMMKVNKTKIVKETKTIQKADGTVLKETRTRVVTTIIEMTDLWLPKLATWIRSTLDLGGSDPAKTLAKLTTTLNSTSTSTHKSTTYHSNYAPATKFSPTTTTTTAKPDGDKSARRKRSSSSSSSTSSSASDESASFFSTPFDNPNNYADFDDPIQLASSAMQQQQMLNNLGRFRRDDNGDDDDEGETGAVIMAESADEQVASTTAAPAPVAARGAGRQSATLMKTLNKLQQKGNLVPTSNDVSVKPQVAKAKITTTPAPATTQPPSVAPTKEPSFEMRISESSNKCAVDGFSELLSIAYDQNSLMYESNKIAKDNPYILAFSEAFKAAFARRWREKRDSWSKSLDNDGSGGDNAQSSRSVDEEIADSFEAHGGAYERGARLGFTVGKFIGDKSANQWPDPAELNTFTYDSLFLAGTGHDYSEEDSKQLERRIVAETAKRVAFSEANRIAFAKTLHSAYLNGAYIVPTWGVLHAQRAVAKQAAKEGGKAGFAAAAKAADEFMPKASKFFQMHRQQRRLAAPYKAIKRLSDKWAGLSEEITEVQFENELSRNISNAAIDCGQKSGTLMGAVMGLVVAPEAFETYTRFRGSLEALESEFNQYKLGAMRGYELGETWALLNYTATMNKNLQLMKTQMGTHPTSPPAGTLITTQAPTSTSVKANITSTFAKKAEKEASTSLFESKTGNDTKSSGDASQDANGGENDDASNTNNIFQFMVLNYGTHLVANHSRKHMLKFRSMFMDENLLHDMKVQSGDLVANPGGVPLSSSNASSSETSIDDSDPFEPGPFAGELRGEFNSLKDETKKRPIKFDILELGPILEFDEDLKPQVAGSNKTSMAAKANANNTSPVLLETPLTADLGKVGKVFLKFSVARRKKKRQLGGPDEVAQYLNGGNKFDQGDGYMSGTFSLIVSPLINGSTVQDPNHPALVDDDFSLEAQTLDELFERIEKTPAEMGSVAMVERVFGGVTTMAPKKVEAIADKKVNATTTTSRPNNPSLAMKLSTSTTTTTSTTNSPSTTDKPDGDDESTTTTSTTSKPDDDE